MFDTVEKITSMGMCTGCGACSGLCDHLEFKPGELGFEMPVVKRTCIHCGKCLEACVFDPDREND